MKVYVFKHLMDNMKFRLISRYKCVYTMFQ